MKIKKALKRIVDQMKRHLIHDYDLKVAKKRGIKIGSNFHSNDSYIDPGFPFLIEIGDNVTLSRASILAHDGSTQYAVDKSRVGKVIIGNNVFVGYLSIVLPNVRIGNNVIIGAGSVVTHDIPSNSIAAGNPCRVIGSFEVFKNKHQNYIKSYPVYPTYHEFKSIAEIEQMKAELTNTFGYDE